MTPTQYGRLLRYVDVGSSGHRAEADPEAARSREVRLDRRLRRAPAGRRSTGRQDIKHARLLRRVHDLKSYRADLGQRLPEEGPDQGQPQRRLDLPPTANRTATRMLSGDAPNRRDECFAREARRQRSAGYRGRPRRDAVVTGNGRPRKATTRKRTRARPGREGGRALIVHATAGQRLDNRDRTVGGSSGDRVRWLNESVVSRVTRCEKPGDPAGGDRAGLDHASTRHACLTSRTTLGGAASCS